MDIVCTYLQAFKTVIHLKNFNIKIISNRKIEVNICDKTYEIIYLKDDGKFRLLIPLDQVIYIENNEYSEKDGNGKILLSELSKNRDYLMTNILAKIERM